MHNYNSLINFNRIVKKYFAARDVPPWEDDAAWDVPHPDDTVYKPLEESSWDKILEESELDQLKKASEKEKEERKQLEEHRNNQTGHIPMQANFATQRSIILPIYMSCGWLLPTDKDRIGVKNLSETEWMGEWQKSKSKAKKELITELENYIKKVKDPKNKNKFDSFALLIGDFEESSPMDKHKFMNNSLVSTAIKNICSARHLDKSKLAGWLEQVWRENLSYNLNVLFPLVMIRCSENKGNIIPYLKSLGYNSEKAEYCKDVFSELMNIIAKNART